MRCFPSITEAFASPFTQAVVMNSLGSHTAPPLMLGTLLRVKPDKFFRGQVGGEHFEIFRTIRGRNSFLPIITGWVVPNENEFGSILWIRHRLHLFAFILAGVWLSFSGMMAAQIVSGWFTPAGFHLFELLGLLPFFAVLFLFPYFFWVEVRKSRSFLVTLLMLTPLESA